MILERKHGLRAKEENEMYQRLNDEHYYRKFYFQDSFYAQCMDVDPLTMEMCIRDR